MTTNFLLISKLLQYFRATKQSEGQNITILTFINRNFHQQTTLINRQLSVDSFYQQTIFIKRQFSSIGIFHQLTIFINSQLSSDNFHPHSPESHQSSLQKASSLTRVTPVKSLEGIFTHQSHISQVFFRYHHSPGSHQSSQC